ncbi:methyl-coenzyme M reductase operon protein D [Methanohalobium evestigatum Z-7303]|uniref:Methyl-coenzyme M reductase operon protein D n=1 Tax=Methanohalobium evestigatum (strain ATCC BAA-1072 / DSM 3721 / NBRC 107634 / OCM 161 / Z-7303) TaxID=644295 RepID=D7E8Y0_METEZ|nr:methyl-coenzyme M reductase operon protein D [Methanohalobium evestigatum]ADI73801.1 methyl-coenzyme M reductase operon protein D [Methanohalobium evestigatum Z-7303]
MVETASEPDEEYLQIELFPTRLLKPETTQNLLEELSEVDGIIRAFIHGPRLPLTVPSGPATGQDVEHPHRKVIQIGDTAIELSISVGRIRLEITDEDVEEEIETIAEKVLPCKYELREGYFIPKESTVTDYAKRGPNADPKRRGLSDPKASEESQVFVLNKPENEDEE